MQNMSDNDLDDLFKTAADGVQYEFKQEAWQHLQQKMQKSRAKRWGILWIVGLLVILPAIIFMAYQFFGTPASVARSGKNKETQIAARNHTKQPPVTTGKPINTIQQNENKQPNTVPNATTDTPAVNKMLHNIGKESSSLLTNNKALQGSTNTSLFAPPLVKVQPPKPGYKYNKIFISVPKKQSSSTQNPSDNSLVAVVTKKHKKTIQDTPPVHYDTTGVKIKALDIKPVLLKYTYSKPVVLPPSLLQKDTVLSAEVVPKKTVRSPRKLSIIAQVAPDLSMVDKFSLGDTRLSGGLLIEYELLKNLSVNTGINYSSKAYQASAEAYTPKQGKWKSGSLPDNINATCRVLEVPLNLRYYFHNQPKHRLFFSSGISSYWMLQERYSFEYTYGQNYSWGTDNENTHLMSILNLSVGWQKNISPRLSIQAEPFLKMPLGGVGSGQVKLRTTGILFGVKYRLF